MPSGGKASFLFWGGPKPGALYLPVLALWPILRVVDIPPVCYREVVLLFSFPTVKFWSATLLGISAHKLGAPPLSGYFRSKNYC